MPSSPRTPTRRRQSASIDFSFASASPQNNGNSSIRPSHSRKSSLSSLHSIRSPVTPRPRSSHEPNGYFGASNDYGNVVEAGNGLGSLADELAEAWDEEEDMEEVVQESRAGGDDAMCNGGSQQQTGPQSDYPHDIGFGMPSNSTLQLVATGSLSPPKLPARPKHRRKDSQYDGSDYGENSELEDAAGISSSLEARMATIEGLARRGTETNGSDADGVIKRVADILKDLGSQSGIENGATRLITAHTALTSHIAHQTRLLQALTHHLLSPLSAPPDASTIDSLLPLLRDIITFIPTPTSQPLSSLRHLQNSTNDLTSTLSYLADTLHMTRQTTTLASRRLRSSREAVAELKREGAEREEGIRWVETGGWDERLSGRECARVCGEVVGGFEEVCRGWRERLVLGDGVEMGVA
ncbi:hypothetical protein MMC08_000743 [Hypocenomyce scalaris]|nr:hypothetical protein [Hypocenomyce scalaris]